jgi:hypothetical protein
MTRTALCVLAAALVFTATSAASAADVKRRGGQFEALVGGSMCIPSHAGCKSSADVVGRTGPSLGLGFTLGFRPLRALMIGAAYNVGFFNPDYMTSPGNADAYRRAYQNSFFGVIRGILPLWRIDLGLELGLGFSRQVFRAEGGVLGFDRQFSQGFALKTAPVVDIYLTRRFFLGAKLDLIWNFHRQVCSAGGGAQVCLTRATTDQASVHQMIVGLHLGTTF